MTQEALKLALEALTIQSDRVTEIGKQREAITAIKEALREHAMREVQRLGQEIEQEPVAKVVCNSAGQISMQTLDGNSFDISKYVGSMFYTTPPKQGKEPVAWLSTDSIGERHLCFDKPLDNDPVQPLYTTPLQPEPVAYWKEHAQGLQRDYDSLLADFQAQRKPLTSKEIRAIEVEVAMSNSFAHPTKAEEFVRAIEAAHGIKENT
jgi:hypothetical protein